MSDTGYAPKVWEFDEEVTRVFDDMLERSIPQYDVMRDLVTSYASSFAKPYHSIVDLGCSRGEALALVRDHLNATSDQGWLGEFVGAEVSEPMVQAARARLGSTATIVHHDLRRGYPRHEQPVAVTLCVLTLMFVPINYRIQLLARAKHATCEGGALILVEKVIGESPAIDDALQAHYHLMKVRNGYEPDDVARKRLALEGVLVPLTAEWNERMLRNAGFANVECFWSWGPFRAWLAVRS